MSKYSYEFKKKVVLEYLAGKGGPVILARKYGIPSETRIKEWVKAYQNLGDEGLMRSRQKKTYSYEYKLGIVEMYLTSELSYMDIALAEKINNPCILLALCFVLLIFSSCFSLWRRWYNFTLAEYNPHFNLFNNENCLFSLFFMLFLSKFMQVQQPVFESSYKFGQPYSFYCYKQEILVQNKRFDLF